MNSLSIYRGKQNRTPNFNSDYLKMEEKGKGKGKGEVEERGGARLGSWICGDCDGSCTGTGTGRYESTDGT